MKILGASLIGSGVLALFLYPAFLVIGVMAAPYLAVCFGCLCVLKAQLDN